MAGLKAYAAVAFIIGLLIGAVVSYAALTVVAPPTPAPTALPEKITIGAVLPLSGGLAAPGRDEKIGIEMAMEDINAWAEKIGLPYKFDVIILDSKTTEEGSRKACETLVEVHGVKVIIGMVGSIEIAGAREYLNAKRIPAVVMGTSPFLAYPDYIFRITAPDSLQAKAMATIANYYGIKKVAAIYRADDYGKGVATSFKKEFEKLGGTVELISYAPEAPPYEPAVRALSDKVKALGVGPETAVVNVLFGEGLEILKVAARDPTLCSVRWIAPETPPVYLEEAVKDPELKAFMEKVGYYWTEPAFEENPLTKEFKERFKAKEGRDYIVYTDVAYDCAWVAVLSIIAAGKYDGEAIAKAIPEVAKRYHGLTGWKLLDENGDLSMMDYGIYKVVEGQKKQIGFYNGLTGTVNIKE
ncbi:MAG: ABC transporter substrate-binding protein [Candidatus Hecatellaceae archaeon]|nr:MAG: hypothetical protein DRO43_03150 [Candidatus Hecatellales archaeon]